jgi:hypothetical protein
MRDEDVVERIRQAMAGWRGPTALPSAARFSSYRGSRVPRLIRPAQAVVVALAVIAFGVSAALGIQSIHSRLNISPAGAEVTPSPQASSASTSESTPGASPEPSVSPTSEPKPAAPAPEPSPTPEHEASPPAETNPTPSPEK